MKECELCKRELKTKLYHEDEKVWVVECEDCKVPMIVWKEHTPVLSEHNLAYVRAIALIYFGKDDLDTGMRSIQNHWHCHLR